MTIVMGTRTQTVSGIYRSQWRPLTQQRMKRVEQLAFRTYAAARWPSSCTSCVPKVATVMGSAAER